MTFPKLRYLQNYITPVNVILLLALIGLVLLLPTLCLSREGFIDKEETEKKLEKLRAKRTKKLTKGKDTGKLDYKIATLERDLWWYNKCPIGSNGQVCSGNGSCTLKGVCECNPGWGGRRNGIIDYDCSVPMFVSKFG
jgi:hypothetical protein